MLLLLHSFVKSLTQCDRQRIAHRPDMNVLFFASACKSQSCMAQNRRCVVTFVLNNCQLERYVDKTQSMSLIYIDCTAHASTVTRRRLKCLRRLVCWVDCSQMVSLSQKVMQKCFSLCHMSHFCLFYTLAQPDISCMVRHLLWSSLLFSNSVAHIGTHICTHDHCVIDPLSCGLI